MTAPGDLLAVLRRMSNQAGFARAYTVEFSCEDRRRQSEEDAHAIDAVAEMFAASRRLENAVNAETEYLSSTKFTAVSEVDALRPFENEVVEATRQLRAALAHFGGVS
jgi:hypothetical protein